LVFFSTVTNEIICLQTQGLYPEAQIDVGVSNDEDVGPMPNTPADQKKASAGVDAGDKGASSAEPSAPNPISSSMWKQADSSIAGRVPPVVPSASGHGHKRPPPATRRNKLIPQTN
jgi:hypothetical protein